MPAVTCVRTARPVIAIPRPQPVPKAPWQGTFEARFKSGRTYTVPVKLTLQLFAHMLEGEGRSLTFPTQGSDPDRRFELTGMRDRNCAAFDLWFAGAKVAHVPWVCEGTVSASADLIGGEWSMGCLKVPDCDCGGAGGRFELKRCW